MKYPSLHLLATSTLVLLVGCGSSVIGGGGGTGGATGTGGSVDTAGSGGTTSGQSSSDLTSSPTLTTGGPCEGEDFSLEPGACAPADPVCHAASNNCLATVDQTGAPLANLRMVQLWTTAPGILTAAQSPVIAGVITKSVTPDLPACHQNGEGSFSWLLSIDFAGGTLKTGSAVPNADPTLPYTFATGGLAGGFGSDFSIDPVTVSLISPFPCGYYTESSDMTLPIYFGGAGDYMLLPLSKTSLEFSLSFGHTCIGNYEVGVADPGSDCLPALFKNGGKIRGFISLAKAEEVLLAPLKRSLCSLLTGAQSVVDADGNKRCTKDANGVVMEKGDSCLATGMDATPDCADAFRYMADFAASGVSIQ